MRGSEGAERFLAAARLLEEGIAQNAYSAAVLLAARGEEILFRGAAGEATPASVFDVASLTKPLTAALFFVLVQQGRLSPRQKVAEVLPVASADPGFREVTFLHLLAHTSGLPAWKPFSLGLREAEAREGKRIRGTAEGHDRVIREILAMPLEAAPGSRCLYSDPGYILLGRAIEAAAFSSLDRLLEREIATPLRMRDTGYLPAARYSECEAGRIVPTGFSEERGREKAGEADDENAAAMGGVAGHAGIFSTAHDLFLFSREILEARRGKGKVLTRASALEMTRRASEPPGCPRTPGWDTPTPAAEGGSQAGSRFSADTVGHLGYTGCSLFIDLSRDAAVALLSNRVAHGKQNDGLRKLRPRIHDAAMDGILAG